MPPGSGPGPSRWVQGGAPLVPDCTTLPAAFGYTLGLSTHRFVQLTAGCMARCKMTD